MVREKGWACKLTFFCHNPFNNLYANYIPFNRLGNKLTQIRNSRKFRPLIFIAFMFCFFALHPYCLDYSSTHSKHKIFCTSFFFFFFHFSNKHFPGLLHMTMNYQFIPLKLALDLYLVFYFWRGIPIPFVVKDYKARMNAICEALFKETKFDVVCLQEVWSNSDFEFFRRNADPNFRYSHYFHRYSPNQHFHNQLITF